MSKTKFVAVTAKVDVMKRGIIFCLFCCGVGLLAVVVIVVLFFSKFVRRRKCFDLDGRSAIIGLGKIKFAIVHGVDGGNKSRLILVLAD